MSVITSGFRQGSQLEPSDVDPDSPLQNILANHPVLAKIRHPEWLAILDRSQLMCVPPKTTLIRSGENVTVLFSFSKARSEYISMERMAVR